MHRQRGEQNAARRASTPPRVDVRHMTLSDLGGGAARTAAPAPSSNCSLAGRRRQDDDDDSGAIVGRSVQVQTWDVETGLATPIGAQMRAANPRRRGEDGHAGVSDRHARPANTRAARVTSSRRAASDHTRKHGANQHHHHQHHQHQQRRSEQRVNGDSGDKRVASPAGGGGGHITFVDAKAASGGVLRPRGTLATQAQKRAFFRARVLLLLGVQLAFFAALWALDTYAVGGVPWNTLATCGFVSFFFVPVSAFMLATFKRTAPVNYVFLCVYNLFSAPYALAVARFVGAALVARFVAFYASFIVAMLLACAVAPRASTFARGMLVCVLVALPVYAAFYLADTAAIAASGAVHDSHHNQQHRRTTPRPHYPGTPMMGTAAVATATDAAAAPLRNLAPLIAHSLSSERHAHHHTHITTLLAAYVALNFICLVLYNINHPPHVYNYTEYVVAFVDVNLAVCVRTFRRVHACMLLVLLALLLVLLTSALLVLPDHAPPPPPH